MTGLRIDSRFHGFDSLVIQCVRVDSRAGMTGLKIDSRESGNDKLVGIPVKAGVTNCKKNSPLWRAIS